MLEFNYTVIFLAQITEQLIARALRVMAKI